MEDVVEIFCKTCGCITQHTSSISYTPIEIFKTEVSAPISYFMCEICKTSQVDDLQKVVDPLKKEFLSAAGKTVVEERSSVRSETRRRQYSKRLVRNLSVLSAAIEHMSLEDFEALECKLNARDIMARSQEGGPNDEGV